MHHTEQFHFSPRFSPMKFHRAPLLPFRRTSVFSIFERRGILDDISLTRRVPRAIGIYLNIKTVGGRCSSIRKYHSARSHSVPRTFGGKRNTLATGAVDIDRTGGAKGHGARRSDENASQRAGGTRAVTTLPRS